MINRNPYQAEAARKFHRLRAMQLQPIVKKTEASERVEAFLGATEIPHGGNRAKVCTGIAHTMSDNDVVDAINLMRAEIAEQVSKLTALSAPEVLITNARRQPPGLKMLMKIAIQRGLVKITL